MVTPGYGPRTAWHGCTLMVWSNNSQDSTGSPCDARTGIVRPPHILRDPYGARTGPARVPYGTRKGAVWHPCGQVRELTQPELAKPRTGVVFGLMEPVRSPHGLFTGWLQYQNPYGVRKLIMHALKLYGPRTGRQNSYGAARARAGPVSGRTIFV